MAPSVDLRRLPLPSVCIALVTALPLFAQVPPEDAQETLQDFNQAYKAKEWDRAIEIGLTLNSLVPRNSTHQYNLACVYSLSGDADTSMKWLGKAAENGFAQVALFEADPDLAAVRDHPEYESALDLVKENHERELTRLRKKFGQRRPLVYPPPDHDAERPAPLIIALHGYGGLAKNVAAQWRTVAAQAGAILVAPDAVRRVRGANGFDWRNVDEADFLLDLTLEFVRERYKIDAERIVLTGFSQGAYIAYAVGARHPQKFIGVIPMAGGYISSLDAPPQAAGERRPRFYFMVGEKDRAVVPCREAAKAFAAAGYDVKLRVYPDVGHRFPKDRDRELREALAYVLDR